MLLALLALLVTLGCERAAPPPAPEPLVARIDQALSAAGRHLMAQQQPDGSFRGTTYGAFKDGYALTPLATSALLFVPHSPDAQSAYQRGASFVATLVVPGDPPGLRAGIDGPSYPTYAAAEALLVLGQRPGRGRYAEAREALIPILLERQMTEARGWSPDDPSYGGWGYFRGVPHKPDAPSPMLEANLSATLFVVGALRLGGLPVDHPAMAKALVFVERCQNYAPPASADPSRDDGGFFFSPGLPDSNKAGAAPGEGSPRYRSYGSMTADGTRALVRLGLPVTHPRVQASAAWLRAQFTAEHNPGRFPKLDEVRRRPSYFYYVWSVAHALRLMGDAEFKQGGRAVRWAEVLAEAVLTRQRPDGAWANTATEMREDEPVIATSFAMAALAVSRMVLTGEWQTAFGRRM